MRWIHVSLIVRHELSVERRAAEVVGLVVPFALAALMTLPVALGIDQVTISRVGFPAFWMISLLFGMQIAWRHRSGHVRALNDQIRLSGVDPAAAFMGRFLANFILLAFFMGAALVGTVLLFTPPQVATWPVLGLAVMLFAVGLAVIATAVGDLTVGFASRGGIAALLVAPLAVPLVLAGGQVSTIVTATQVRPGGILPWMLVLVLVDLIGITAGVLTAKPLEESLG